MGKNRAKRVKRAWRNISTEEIDNFNEKTTRDANTGGSLTQTPSKSLFFVDKSTDVPVKKKIEKHREKVLRHESLLERNPFVKPVKSSVLKKVKRKVKESGDNAAAQVKEDGELETGMVDLWGDEDADDKKRYKKAKPSIPAVEVEHPGCSYNPEDESHKDSLGLAVAEEMKKVYKKELGPKPVPLTVPGEPITEEERYFLEVDHGTEDEEEDDESDSEDVEAQRKPKQKRVTRVEQNRRLRRKGQLKAEAEAKKVKDLSKEIDSIPDILQEIADEDEEKQNKHIRRTVAKEERLKAGPPRLGKRKFEPAPVQVLLTEEITGSLRKLKACYSLARDRFKSLEKRGLIVPSAKGGTSRK